MAHSEVARGQGVPVYNITLFIFGGAAQITQEPKEAKGRICDGLCMGPGSKPCLKRHILDIISITQQYQRTHCNDFIMAGKH